MQADEEGGLPQVRSLTLPGVKDLVDGEGLHSVEEGR